jgi:hypothetical protein
VRRKELLATEIGHRRLASPLTQPLTVLTEAKVGFVGTRDTRANRSNELDKTQSVDARSSCAPLSECRPSDRERGASIEYQ